MAQRIYPWLAKVEGTVHASVLVQQFTHLIHPDRSYRLSNLLRQFADKKGNIHNNRKQTKYKRKNNEQIVHAANISLFGNVMVSL